MNGTKTLVALLMIAVLPLSGCLGIFGGDSGGDQDANATSISQSVGDETAREIESRSAEQFKNYTLPGQEKLPGVTQWFNGSVSTGQAAAAWEDRNDRSGTNYNTEIVTRSLGDALPAGQPAEIKVKLWYFPGPGKSAAIDIYADVPGTATEFNPGGCDAFSWKVCTQELVLNTAGVSGEDAQVGIQIANGRTAQTLDYQLKVELTYEDNVITPAQPYAFQVPENATGIVVKSQKAGGGEHVKTNFVVVSPNDELVQHVEYNDIAIPSESKLIPVSQSGEYILFPIEMSGGFLSVEANTPVPDAQRQGRVLDLKTETVTDASTPTPGTGETCIPSATSQGCAQNTTWNQGGSSAFTIEGAFPLEVTTWINQGGPNANVDAEIQVLSEQGLVHRSKKIVQYEDSRGTIGMSRDEMTTQANWGNLAKGEYTVRYVIDGTAEVGHTVKTYKR